MLTALLELGKFRSTESGVVLDFLVVDIETTGLDWKRDRIHGVAICNGEGAAYLRPHELFKSGFIDHFETIPVVGHNVRFDLKFINQETGSLPSEWHDTRLIAHLLDENNGTGLKELVPRYLGEGRLSDKKEMDAACKRAGVRNIAELCALDIDGNSQFPPGSFTNIIAKYAIEDARNTYDVYLKLSEALSKDERLCEYYFEEAQPFEQTLLELELRGIRVDEGVLDAYGQELRLEQAKLELEMTALCSAEINEIEEGLYEKAKAKRKSQKGKDSVVRRSEKHSTRFSFGSTANVGSLVFERLGAHECKTAKGNWDTSEATLQGLKEGAADKLKAFLELFLKWRGVQKALSTYVDGYKEHIHNGRIHGSYGQYTVTGRTHSSEPNLQNIPRGSKVKRAFVPAPGNVFVYFDYSQIELRIAAHLSQDEQMLEQFRLGIDPHKMTAKAIFGECETDEQRQVGKTCNFLLIYDGSPNRLQEELGERYSLDECKDFKQRYFSMYAGYKQYLRQQLSEMRSSKSLRSTTGRIRSLPDITYGAYLNWEHRIFTGSGQLVEALRAWPNEYMSSNTVFDRASKRFSHAKKQGYNFPVQHLGAHIMKKALMALGAAGYEIVATVHDSGTIELPIDRLSELGEIRQIIENAYQLSVPLKADIKILNSLDEKDLFSLSDTLHVA